MRALITGGAGFIGTHLCRQLIRGGHSVRVLDLKKPAEAVHGVEYRQGDVRRGEDVRSAVEGVEAVFHFAAMVSVPLCQEKPIESYETNLLGTARVLEAIRDQARRSSPGSPSALPARIVFAGSSAVYGNLGKPGVPLLESSTLPSPLSFYGAQKLGSEHMIRVFFEKEKIPSTVFRFFNVYGQGQDPSSPYSGVISIFHRRALEGKSLMLQGGGKQTRDFVAVGDVVRACASVLEIPARECRPEPMNIGTGKPTTIRELAETICRAVGKSVPLEDAPAREGDVPHSLASIEEARKRLRWAPELGLEQGLRGL